MNKKKNFTVNLSFPEELLPYQKKSKMLPHQRHNRDGLTLPFQKSKHDDFVVDYKRKGKKNGK